MTEEQLKTANEIIKRIEQLREDSKVLKLACSDNFLEREISIGVHGAGSVTLRKSVMKTICRIGLAENLTLLREFEQKLADL